MPYSLLRSFRKVFAAILIVISWNILAPTCFAQVATGTPPFGSFAGGPDVVNLGNLNDHLTIPVLHKAGRGTDFAYDLTYDSSIWYPVGVSPHQLWQPVSNWGWSAQTQGPNGYIAYNTTQIQITCTTTGGIVYKRYFINQYTFTTYYDQLGAAHAVNTTVSQQLLPGFSGCSPSPAYPYSATVKAVDGSGLTFNLTALPQAAVITPGGTTIYPPYNQSSGAGSYTDRNGNIISTSGGVFTDTLGTTTLTVTGGGTASSPMKLTYTAPSGAAAAYTMNYTNFTVATNFGVSGITDYTSTSAVPLVTSIVLPDNSQYSFVYEPGPGNCTLNSGTTSCVTGRVKQITLPRGGQISFAYSFTGCTTTIFTDGSAACLQRTTPDGVWTYARTLGSGAASATLVTAPQLPYDSAANQTIIQFQGIYETQRDIYQGSGPAYTSLPIAESTLQSGGLKREIQTCYNASSTPCTSTAVALPISQRSLSTQLAGASSWANALTGQHIEKYSSYGVLTEQDDYDYGVGAVGALLGKTILTVSTLGNVNTFYQEVKVTNGSGATVSDTLYGYDETSVTAPPNQPTPQHTSVSGSRGNLTSVNYPVNGAGITSHFTYYDTGNVNVATDVNNGTTTYTYGALSATCGNAFPTAITEAISTLTQSYTWNCTGGAQLTVTDENNQTTTTAYSDPYFWRPASESFPDGGQISWTYNSPTSFTTTTKMNSSQNIVRTVLLDGLGRTSQTQLADPEGNDYAVMTYDALGRPYKTYNPTRCSPPTTNCGEATWGYTTTAYDALGRVTSFTQQDGSVALTSYTNNTATAADPAGKTRQSMLDALGRLTQVIEDPGSSPHLNYLTSYTLDPLGNILNVTQNGGNQRTFVYDELSRLTSETNPETGTIAYKYDSDSNCASPNSSSGDLLSRTDARSIRTCLQYDALHRVTQKNYSDSTPTATYVYDVTSIDGYTNLKNTAGRLVRGATSGTYPNKIYYQYDPMGRVIIQGSCGYVNCGTSLWLINNTYDLAGDLTSYNDAFGNTLTQSFDSAGRPAQLTSSWSDSTHPSPLYTADASVGYYPHGGLRKMALGNGLTQTGAFNNGLQPCRINVNSSSTALGTCADSIPSGNVQDFNYAFNAGSTDNGNVMNWNATGQQAFTRSFTYDSINRLSQMTETSGSAEGCKPPSSSSSPYTLTETYDAWGNRNAQTPNSGTCSFSQTANSNNQLPSPYQYDAAGNLTNDGTTSYAYDAENRISSATNSTSGTTIYNYDASGNRLAKTTFINNTTSTTYYVYGSDGQVVADTGTQGNWNETYIHFGGQLIAQYRGTNTGFILKDHLGSARLDVLSDQTVYDNVDYLPFGEQISGGWGTTHKFTGDERDIETNLDHTQFRQYSPQLGRWMHPDPAGLLAVDPTNPQSWNRYAYVLNNPLALVDPFGLTVGNDCGGGPCSDFFYTGSDGCTYLVTFDQQSDPAGNVYDVPTATPVGCGPSGLPFSPLIPNVLINGGGGGIGGLTTCTTALTGGVSCETIPSSNVIAQLENTLAKAKCVGTETGKSYADAKNGLKSIFLVGVGFLTGGAEGGGIAAGADLVYEGNMASLKCSQPGVIPAPVVLPLVP